jgi:hypothetical protein
LNTKDTKTNLINTKTAPLKYHEYSLCSRAGEDKTAKHKYIILSYLAQWGEFAALGG